MKLLQRLKRIEEIKAPRLSPEEQKDLLNAYIEIETIYSGKPPSEEEIEAEKERLSKITKFSLRPEELGKIADEIENLFV